MTGWNMPDGCNTNDIPGNRPEDAAWEAAAERITQALTELEKSDDDLVARIATLLLSSEGERLFEHLVEEDAETTREFDEGGLGK